MTRALPPIAAHVFRQHRRTALVWGGVFGAFAYVSTVGYAASYPDAADRVSFARALEANVGIRAVFGPARDLDTVAGFTAWRCAGVFVLLGAVWGFLLATKLLRGDEEEGRAELLYTAPVTRAGGIRQSLAGLFAVWATLFLTAVVLVVTIGTAGDYYGFGAGVFFAVVSCSGAAMGIAVGALSSQLTISRRAASSLAGGFFGVAFVLRALGESVDGARWVLWLSPVSWVDKTRPLTGSRFAPLLLVVALAVACTLGAAVLARRRDLGGAVFPSRDTAEARTGLLGSSLGLSMRLARPTIIGWGAGVFVAAAVFGTVSSAISEGLVTNEGVADIFARMGSELSTKGYIGLTFVLLGNALSATAAALVGATRKEEGEGRLEHLAATPTPRWRWLAGRVAASVLTLSVIGAAAGVGGWLGVRASGGDLALGAMLLAGLNIIPPGVLTLGVGTFVYGLAGQIAVSVSYAVVVWSFLIEVVGGVIEIPRVVANTSLIHHLTAAPLVAPNWSTNAVMVAVGVACAAAGAFSLQRRDLQPG